MVKKIFLSCIIITAALLVILLNVRAVYVYHLYGDGLLFFLFNFVSGILAGHKLVRIWNKPNL